MKTDRSMNMGSKNSRSTNTANASPWQNWRGLAGWNFYFLLKFAMLWYGYLNFHPLANLVFLAFLLLPLPSELLHKIRKWIALPISLGLLYYDTWLPGINSIISNAGQVINFSTDYLLELVNRFINWNLIGAGFVLLVSYLFLAQWIRVTTITVLILFWLNIQPIIPPSLIPSFSTNSSTSIPSTPAANNEPPTANVPPANNPQLDSSAPPTNQNLNSYLEQFYQTEKARKVIFPTVLPADAEPLDVLIINICSLSWSDMQAAGLIDHPLWSRFDIVLKNFDSATSYSGPASIRLLRASCGQQSHVDLYKATDQQCYLFDDLAKLGFKEQLMMDHSGKFDNYLNSLRELGGLKAPLMSQAGLGNDLTSFDGEVIYKSDALFSRWLEQRNANNTELRNATFVNLIALHDGNRLSSTNKPAVYQASAKKLFDDINQFIDQLVQSGRKILVIVVPEHGAALVGDKMQISGLRDIPAPSITLVPVGIKLIGAKAPAPSAPIQVTTPTSYLAIGEIVAKIIDGKILNEATIDWTGLAQKLPQTARVSENSGVIVIDYQDKSYVKLNKGDWVPYPQ